MQEPNKDYTRFYEDKTLDDLRARGTVFEQRRKKPVLFEKTAATLQYEKKLMERERSETDMSISALLNTVTAKNAGKEVIPYAITPANAITLFMAIWQQTVGAALVADKETTDKVHNLVMYFTGNKGRYALHKGIYLVGDVGRGKTKLMQALQRFTGLLEARMEDNHITYTKRGFKLTTCKAITKQVSDSKGTNVLNQYNTGPWCFDDLGAEDEQKLYGNQLNIMADVLTERYVKCQQSGLLTHVTSNIKPNQWEQVYGKRIASRMNEMFSIVLLPGPDHRGP